MGLVNPIDMWLSESSAARSRGVADHRLSSRGMLRMGDRRESTTPDEDPATVYIVADTLIQAERTAREKGLEAGAWRALVNAEDLWWFRPRHGSQVIDAGCDPGRARQIRAALN